VQTRVKALTMVDAFFPDVSRARDIARDIFLVIGFAAVIALSARIAFNVGPVPITGQTFGVLITGALLGSRRGASSVATYLAIGATGMPFWFSPTTLPGVAAFAGPTAGYLVGFIPMAFVVGFLTERGWDRRVWTAVIAMVIGLVVLYALGLSWLAIWLHRHSVDKSVLAVGLFPFLPGEALKITLVSASLPGGWYLMKRFGTKQ
jgi:biotin transporter BioY